MRRRPVVDHCWGCGESLAEVRACACCGAHVGRCCAEEIGGMTHCPSCASAAREFISEGVSDVPAGLRGDGQTQLPQPG